MLKILFICTHNRCRSILSEAITNHLSEGLITAKSAGSQPVGQVHPLSLKYLEETEFPIDGLKSQSWDDFEDFAPDLVITVCDSAANETCPIYFTQSAKLHWGLSDPSKIEGNDEIVRKAFLDCIEEVKGRVELLKQLIRKSLSTEQIVEEVQKHQ